MIRTVKDLIERLDRGATVSKVGHFEGREPGWSWVITETNEPVSKTSVNAVAKRAVVLRLDLCGEPMQLGGPVSLVATEG